MIDQEILDRAERAARSVDLPDGRFEELLRRHDRKRRNQRVTGGALGMGIFVVLVWFVTSAGPLDGTQTPVTPEGSETEHAAAGSRATTRVTIHSKRVPFGQARLWGIVESERPLRCARGREVVVYRQRGSEQDPKTDLEVAHDIASVRLIGDSYKWRLTLHGDDAPHYARVKRTESCRADASRTAFVRFGGG
jgi:hypothetical protein